MSMFAKVEISVAELLDLNEKRVLAEQKVKELEERIEKMIVSKSERKKSVKKEYTAEEIEELKIKRSEAGKKGAAKRTEKAAAKKAAEREQLVAQIKAELESEMNSVASQSESETGNGTD